MPHFPYNPANRPPLLSAEEVDAMTSRELRDYKIQVERWEVQFHSDTSAGGIDYGAETRRLKSLITVVERKEQDQELEDIKFEREADKAEQEARLEAQEVFQQKIRDEGVLGEAGIKRIVGFMEERHKLAQAERNQKLKRVASGLRRGLGKRLGSRSGAVDQIVANRVQAPALGEQFASMRDLAGLEAGLFERNEFSKQAGAQGIQSIINFLESQSRFDTGFDFRGLEFGENTRRFDVGAGFQREQLDLQRQELEQSGGRSFLDLVSLGSDFINLLGSGRDRDRDPNDRNDPSRPYGPV